jgi:hypothetical protein
VIKNWLKRIRGALGVGVSWALGWALIGGTLMEGIFDPHGEILDMWPQTLAIPGFLLGVVFSVVLWATAGRRRFDELSVPRFAALGAAAGALLGSAVLTAGIFPALPLLLRAGIVLGPLTVLSAASASGTLAIARMARDKGFIDPGSGDPALEATKQRLPGRG